MILKKIKGSFSGVSSMMLEVSHDCCNMSFKVDM